MFQNRLATYGIAAVVLLVLALLAPLFARGWLMTFVLIALVIAGIEVTRRIVLREPDVPAAIAPD